MKIILNLSFLCFLLFGGVKGAAATDPDSIIVLFIKDELPKDAVKVGQIKIKDGGFKTNCSYEQSMFETRMKAQHLGANIIKLTELKPPDAWSSCYRMKADVFKMDDANFSVLRRKLQMQEDSVMASLLPDTASYALLYVYRLPGIGPIVEYNLHIDDTVVCRVFNNSKYVIRIDDPGKKTVWARTEARDEVFMDVQKGQVYFLKCSVSMGAFVGHPKLEVIKAAQGLREFEQIKDKQMDKESKAIVP